MRGSIRRQLFQHSEIWKTQRFKIIGGPCASQPRSVEGTIPTPRWHLAASKRLANAHSECVTIPSLSDIGSQIDVVLLTERKSQPTASAGQEVPALHRL